MSPGSRRRIRRGLSGLGWTVLPALLVAAGACSRRADLDEVDAEATNLPDAPPSEVGVALDSGTGEESEVLVNTDDPFAVFGLESTSDVDATIDTTPVWLVNGRPTALVVTAEAGAGSVLIDTIPPADSIQVRIATRAAFVRLSATTAEGEPAGTTNLRADGQVDRVAFPR